MSQYRERPECRVKRLNILCHCVTCIQIVHGVKVAIESEVRGTLPNSHRTAEIEYIWRLQITRHKLLWEGHLHMLGIRTLPYKLRKLHSAHCKFHISQCKAQSADAGVGQLKHPLQDHHSQVVVGAISLKFVKNNLHNIVLLPVLSSLI